MTNLYKRAAKENWRFNSTKGQMTVEDLFKLALTSQTGAACLNKVAIDLSRQIRETGEETFVDTGSNPQLTRWKDQLELVKDVIADKQDENAARQDARAKAEKRQKLLDILDKKQENKLEGLSEDEIRKQLAEL